MKTLKLFIALVSFCLISMQLQVYAKGSTKSVDIKTSAVCESCEAKIEKGLKKADGVKKVSMNLDTKTVTVVFNPEKTDAEKIKKAITLLGYDADNMTADPAAYDKLERCCKKETKK